MSFLFRKSCFIFSLLLLIVHSASAAPEFPKEADIPIYRLAIRAGFTPEQAVIFEPSKWAVQDRIIRNARFIPVRPLQDALHGLHGYPGAIKPDIASWRASSTLQYVCQALFPGQDESYLLPNQRASDYLSGLSLERAAKLLRMLTIDRSPTTPISVERIYQIIANSDHVPPEFDSKTAERYVQNLVASSFYNDMDDIRRYHAESGTVFHCQTDIHSYLLSVAFTPAAYEASLASGTPYFEPGDIEREHHIKEKIDEIRQAKRKQTQLTDDQEAFLRETPHARLCVDYPKELLCYYTAMQLYNACLEDWGNVYPHNMITRAFVMFARERVHQTEDMLVFYQASFNLVDDEIAMLRTAFQQKYTKADFHREHALYLQACQESHVDRYIGDTDLLALVLNGDEIFGKGAFLRPLKSQKVAYIPRKEIQAATQRKSRLVGMEYPDCVETCARNLFNIFASIDDQDGGIHFVPGQIHASREVQLFYEHFPDFHAQRQQPAFEEWSGLMADRPDQSYVKPVSAQKEKRRFELVVGWANFIQSLSWLFEDEYATPIRRQLQELRALHHHTNEMPYKEKEQAGERIIGQALDSLCKLLTGTRGQVSWATEDDGLALYDKYQDYLGDITFSIDGKKIATVSHARLHAELTIHQDSELSTLIPYATLPSWLSDPHAQPLLSLVLGRHFFAYIEDVERSNERAANEIPFALPLADIDDQYSILHAYTNRRVERYTNLLCGLLQKIAEREDDSYILGVTTQLGNTLFAKPEVIQDVVIERLVRSFPQLVDKYKTKVNQELLQPGQTASDEVTIEGHPGFLAYRYKNERVMAYSYKYARHLGIEPTISIGKETVDIQEELPGYIETLPQHERLEELSISNNALATPPVYETFLNIVERLHHLKALAFFDQETLPLEAYLRTIDRLPNSLKTLQISGGDVTNEIEKLEKLVYHLFLKNPEIDFVIQIPRNHLNAGQLEENTETIQQRLMKASGITKPSQITVSFLEESADAAAEAAESNETSVPAGADAAATHHPV